MEKFTDILVLGMAFIIAAVIVTSCHPQQSPIVSEWENNNKVVTSHFNAEERAATFCTDKGSSNLSVQKNNKSISVVCKDNPDVMVTFLL